MAVAAGSPRTMVDRGPNQRRQFVPIVSAQLAMNWRAAQKSAMPRAAGPYARTSIPGNRRRASLDLTPFADEVLRAENTENTAIASDADRDGRAASDADSAVREPSAATKKTTSEPICSPCRCFGRTGCHVTRTRHGNENTTTEPICSGEPVSAELADMFQELAGASKNATNEPIFAGNASKLTPVLPGASHTGAKTRRTNPFALATTKWVNPLLTLNLNSPQCKMRRPNPFSPSLFTKNGSIPPHQYERNRRRIRHFGCPMTRTSDGHHGPHHQDETHRCIRYCRQ